MADAFPKHVLNVRMYNVGFGDCFLLSFPVGEEHRHVLVDCGAHVKGSLGNLEQIARNIDEMTNHRLAAVVATHRHQDHIWGFERGRGTFRGMTVDEVWLPWVEETANPEARALWKQHEKVRARLMASLALSPAGARRSAVEAVLLNLKPNEVALDELRSRFGQGKDAVKYLYGGHPEMVAPCGIEGLSVKVLGPPKDEKFLKKMMPPKAERWALAMAGGTLASPDLFESPFDERWEDSGAYWETEESRVFDKAERELFDRRIGDALDLAFALEDAVNNSSLALLFQFGGQGLLMPGDAQWGNWQSWMDQGGGENVFEPVTLFKVGHHGSHNATPRTVVDRLPHGVAVLVPTHDKPFPTIPEPKLIAALQTRSNERVVRSDASGELPAGFTAGEYWIDYRAEIP